MERSPSQHEPISIYGLGTRIESYEEAIFPYSSANFLKAAHEHHRMEMTEKEYLEFEDEHPLPDEEELAELEKMHAEETKRFADNLSIEVDEVSGLISAYHAESSRMTQNEAWKRSPEQEDRFPGMCVGVGVTHGDFAAGVLTLANLTGETYTISNVGSHVGPAEEMYSYQVQPGQTLEEIFSDHQS